MKPASVGKRKSPAEMGTIPAATPAERLSEACVRGHVQIGLQITAASSCLYGQQHEEQSCEPTCAAFGFSDLIRFWLLSGHRAKPSWCQHLKGDQIPTLSVRLCPVCERLLI